MNAQSWVDLKQDADTGIEVIRAHFEGHAYDPHWHDSYLIGFTEQGVQQFNCRRALFSSVPGQTFFLEPGDIHDGNAPAPGGFTYSTLYLEPAWLQGALPALFEQAPVDCLPSVPRTQPDDPGLLPHIANALQALREGEPRMVRDAALDGLLERLSRNLQWRQRMQGNPQIPGVALRARDYLHAHFHENIGLGELARVCGVDRFHLTRAFKAAFGIAPHGYLIQLRLVRARRLLALGSAPADVASDLGFADQSHLGRWFRRANGVTPGAYRSLCTKLQDR
ncbi:HTH-type transcriptional activator Btr [Pseudomonas sp. THAF187a]|uniref:AraC family transcriptional regulator n=1 Tax=Ectopseudomonas khazarica TaxID=2502979 RepID=A0ABW7MGR2_9GAMM|nr:MULTISPECIES: AraC family transcriptional regulator [Pseudomonas]QFT24719.1 HTH-type transcriptional activator Btr [Pseudomonas sp. THAF187a]QFT44906.1 HTH-type transcriptional activator Btr [Pseudomonas sp. THAF42]QTS86536.1 AraC family transcriptional regulator [Pseudomonas khazarica]HIQ41948.1 AraC family transcriptional regulator [Pseudomonas oleovorans]|tara:strand:- start:172 stop:1011 length:840 start_codon:yes stop_codon:yes gene_type:complete